MTIDQKHVTNTNHALNDSDNINGIKKETEKNKKINKSQKTTTYNFGIDTMRNTLQKVKGYRTGYK